jgi:demethylmenaquinone methyltransferase/2-methoxy-6-polyprenyl-1,4-benzoquinol methylase
MGLGSSYWQEVIVVLREIIPIYDKVNYYISLGRDKRQRNQGIKGHVFPGNEILDAGSGFGNMSKTALELCDNKVKITLYDPLVPMLKNTATFFQDRKLDMTCGVFEHIPFRNGQFDAVLCGYSLRDAISLKIAISEIHRVLKSDGRLVIVDLGKPDNLFVRMGVSFYLRIVLPIIAFMVGGKTGLKFGTLYGTYKRWPQNKKLETILLEKFTKVNFETDLMGGAVMITAYK